MEIIKIKCAKKYCFICQDNSILHVDMRTKSTQALTGFYNQRAAILKPVTLHIPINVLLLCLETQQNEIYILQQVVFILYKTITTNDHFSMFIITYIYRSNVNLQHILHMHFTAFYNFHKCKSIIFISLVTLARPSLVVFAKMAPIPEKMFNLKCKMEILKLQVLYTLVPVGI